MKRSDSVLAHFLPHDVLKDARDLSLSFQRDDAFRKHVLRRMWYVIPLGLAFFLLGSACAAAPFLFATYVLGATRPSPGWLVLALVLTAGLWLGAIVSQFHTLFSLLEMRAFRSTDTPAPSRARSSLLLVSLFVFLPLILLAVASPRTIVVLLAAAGIFGPILYALFRR